MPSVSIVIPAYDPGRLLGEALESVHRQTFTDWDVTVTDDGSAEDLSWVTTEFPRVTLLRQDNAGASVARNRGILTSTGPLISYMDQDDLWTPDKLAHQVDAFARTPEAGLCCCDVRVFTDARETDAIEEGGDPPPIDVVLDPRRPPTTSSALHDSLVYFANAFVVPSSVMVRRDCLARSGLMDPWSPFTGDFDLLIRIGASFPVVRVHSPDVWYRKHDQNFSDQYDVGRRELQLMRARYVRHARDTDDPDLARAAKETLRRPRRLYAAQAFDGARYAWRRRDLRATGYHLMRSVTFNPSVVVGAVTSRVPGVGR